MPGKFENVIQVGAPVQHNWGDVGQDRGVWITDTETNEPEFHPLINHPKFVVMKDLADLDSAASCDFVRVKVSDPALAAEIIKKAKEHVSDVVAIIEKKHEVARREGIKTGTVGNMLAQWITIHPALHDVGDLMLKTYSEVCHD